MKKSIKDKCRIILKMGLKSMIGKWIPMMIKKSSNHKPLKFVMKAKKQLATPIL